MGTWIAIPINNSTQVLKELISAGETIKWLLES
jgi:hypothetical protein